MITYQSELKTNNFYILKSCCELIVPQKENDPVHTFLSYPLDIEYSIKGQNNDKTFRVLMDIKINYPGKLPGYAIMVEAMGDFTIDSSEKKIKFDIEHLKNFVAIERCIEYIRGYVSTVTAQYPLGKYIFASINMDALYKEKLEQRKKIKTSESKIKKRETK